MSNPSSLQPTDDLTPELRKALVEIGAVIPTTTADVALAERHLECQLSQSQIDASFSQIERMLAHQSAPKAAPVRYKTNAASSMGLALAARNGSEIDEATKRTLVVNVDTIQTQLSDDQPDGRIIRPAWEKILSHLTKVASLGDLLLSIAEKLRPVLY